MSAIEIKATRSSHSTSRTRSLNEVYDWPWKFEVELFPDKSQKICFLSGKEREYFPAQPGFSRHAVEYSMNCHPGDVPNPSYFPSEDRLQKPISLKGYGIGGLSAPRFPGESKNRFGRKEQSRKSSSSAQDEKGQAGRNSSDDKNMSPEVLTSVWKKELKLTDKVAPILTPEQCKQRKWAFGQSVHAPKFAKSNGGSDGVGVGHYEVSIPKHCKRIPVSTVFGAGPVTIHEKTQTICNFEGFDHCIECHRCLDSTDYYRSLRSIAIPQNYFHTYSNQSEYTQPSPTVKSSPTKLTRMDRVMLAISNSKLSLDPGELKMDHAKHIAFCPTCYFEIIQTGHEYWTPKRLVGGKFTKTRHCVNIHEHNNLPVFVHKVPCKLIQKLKRKEALMNKYFPDRCDKVDRER